MKKWVVYGTTYIDVEIEVEAEDDDSAIDEAYKQLDILTCSNSSDNRNCSISVINENARLESRNIIVYDGADFIGEVKD